MKFTANASNLASALALVMRSINTKLSLTGGRGVLMEATGDRLTLTGTDLDTVTRISLAARVDQPGALLLSAEKLSAAFLRPSASDAQFHARPGAHVTLTIGRSRFTLPQMDVDNFPPVQVVADDPVLVLPGAQFHLASAQVSFAAATKEDNKPALEGTAFRFKHSHVQVVAGVGERQIVELQLPYPESGPRPEPGTEVVLPPVSLDRMERLFSETDRVRLSVSGNWVGFFVEDRAFFTKTQAEPFPPAVDAIIEAQHAAACSWLEADRAALLDAARRMMVVASGAPVFPLRLRAYGAKLEFFSSTPDGEAHEEVDVDRDGPEYRGVVNARHLVSWLDHIPGDRVRIDLPEKPTGAPLLRPATLPEGSPPYVIVGTPVSPGAPDAAATWAGARTVDPALADEVAQLEGVA
jgi:DNA polymerase-3 subunit beta